MYNWLYFIRSNEDFHKLMGYLLGDKGVSGITYLIFSEDVKCSDSRVFLSNDGFLITVNFFTQTTSFKDNMVNNGLNLDSLVDLYEIVCEDKNPSTRGITITEKAERIVFDKDFKVFLKRNIFKFKDGSTLTIPKVSSNRRL
ncbi:hypothetical protein LCGC14_3127610 [marine sediment metagenome]|uniref:Uncharacterized protein n=1 Tax=marine sediment metagenome TaxID=412755 RepID=A0A0F8WPE7_9ZZZZ